MPQYRHLTESELARIQAMCEAARPGPWKASIEGRDHESGSSFIQTVGEDIELTGATNADFDFIASARQDVPRLLCEVRELRQQLARLRRNAEEH